MVINSDSSHAQCGFNCVAIISLYGFFFFFLKFLMLPIADSWEKKSASRHEEAPGPKRCKLETHMNNTELIKGTKSC